MVNLSYDISNKRKYYRLTNPVKVIMEGKEYTTLDWSVGGLKIANYAGFLENNDESTIEFEVNFQGFKVKFSQKVRVLRFDAKDGSLVVEYIDILPRNREFLVCFSKRLITGEFQPFGEVISHVDVPITHDYINDKFIEDTSGSFPKNQWLTVFSQILVGIIVGMVIFYLAYSHFHFIHVESAVVTSRTEILNSPTKGLVSAVFVEEGENVTEGQPLFRVVNPEFERDIADRKIEILKNRALLKEKEAQLENNAQAAKIAFLKDELEKKTLLYEKKLVSKPEIDELQGKILQLEQELAVLQAEEERLKGIIEINQRDLAFSESINTQNTVKAPFDSILEENFAFKGKYVDEKTPLAVIKSNSSDKYIEAYLNESQSHKLALNSSVNIEIPLYDLEFEGKLVEIRKNDGLITATIEPKTPDSVKGIKLETPAKVSFVRNF